MKKIGFVLLVLLLVSCVKPRNEVRYYLTVSKTPDSLSRGSLYEMHIKDTIVTGYVYSNFVSKDTSMIEGIVNESGKIKWVDYDDPKYKNDSFHYGIVNENGTITHDPNPKYKDYNFFSDYDVLTPIDKAAFKAKKAAYFPPVRKTNWVRTVIEGDFIFDVRVDGWDEEDYKGKTTFTIKDKKSGKVLQHIKTNEFQCNQYVQFGFRDVNFDDLPDLIVPIGPMGNRMTEISECYLYDKVQNQFIANENLNWAYSGINTELDEKRKRIVNVSSSGGGIMFTEFQVDGLHVEPTRKVDISYWSDSRYDVEIMLWKNDSFQTVRKKTITPKEFSRSKTFEQLFKI